jgi:ketosteroid isomerase-like protein
MSKKFQFAMFAAITALLVSCSNGEKKAEAVDLEKVKVEIQAMEDAYAAAEKAKDADAVVAYYADNAVSYHRNEPTSNGKAEIKEYHKNRLAKDSTGNHNVYKVVDLFGEGDMLVEVGSFSEVTPAGAEADMGFYMSYFQKKDGKYLCVRDINVSTKPK